MKHKNTCTVHDLTFGGVCMNCQDGETNNPSIEAKMSRLEGLGFEFLSKNEWWVDANINPTFELMKILGWQGGTIHQVCAELNCSIEDILYSGKSKFLELRRLAHSIWNQHQK